MGSEDSRASWRPSSGPAVAAHAEAPSPRAWLLGPPPLLLLLQAQSSPPVLAQLLPQPTAARCPLPTVAAGTIPLRPQSRVSLLPTVTCSTVPSDFIYKAWVLRLKIHDSSSRASNQAQSPLWGRAQCEGSGGTPCLWGGSGVWWGSHARLRHVWACRTEK